MRWSNLSRGNTGRSTYSSIMVATIGMLLLVAAPLVVSVPSTTATETTAVADEGRYGHGSSNPSTSIRRTSDHGELHVDKLKQCTTKAMRERVVDPASYKYGCEDIQRMLEGENTLVGKGGVREVYRVDYDGQTLAVKTLRPLDNERRNLLHLEMHRQEVRVSDALRGSPNIVAMLGICNTTVVTGFYPENFETMSSNREEELLISEVVSMALGAARGLQAVHEVVGGIYFDLNPSQMLVDDTGRGMLNDFNQVHFSELDNTGTECVVHIGGAARYQIWRAPETYTEKLVSQKIDIYSLAMSYYTLINGNPPHVLKTDSEEALSSKDMPEINSSWHAGFVQLIQEMWQENPQLRPSAREVVTRLTAIQDQL